MTSNGDIDRAVAADDDLDLASLTDGFDDLEGTPHANLGMGRLARLQPITTFDEVAVIVSRARRDVRKLQDLLDEITGDWHHDNLPVTLAAKRMKDVVHLLQENGFAPKGAR